MVSTRTRIILVTIGGFIVTVALEAVALLFYVTMMLNEPLVLSSFRPWLVFPPLLLAALIGVLGGVLAGAIVVLRSPKPLKVEAPPSTQTSPTVVGQFPPKVREVGRMHFFLPTTGPYVMLTVDQARDIEAMVDRMQEEIGSLTDRLASADRLLGEMTRGTFVSKLADLESRPSSSTEPLQERSKSGFPMVICEKCGTKFEQTISGRTKCPDCWSLEEYLSKPTQASPPSVQTVQQPVDDFSAILRRLERSPHLLVTLRYVGDHPGMKVVDIAKEMKLGRGTVSDRVNDLVRAGLVEKADGGFKLTAKGIDAREATATLQVDTGAGAGTAAAPAPPPST